MLEIERRYDYEREEDLALLLSGAEPIITQRIEDAYFDTHDFRLMRADLWLRVRNGVACELKAGNNTIGKPHDTYHEYRFVFGDDPHSMEDIARITGLHGFPRDGTRESVEAWLVELGLKPHVTYVNNRRSYQRDGMRIDVDNINNGVVKMVEIELIVSSEDERIRAIERIEALARASHLIPNKLGKVGAALKGTGSPGYQVYCDRFSYNS